jgi:peptidoglycan/LPS O-acetylase OafA/YrhL
MYFPTWIDMVLLLASFIWLNIQQLLVMQRKSSRGYLARLLAMTFYIGLMVVVVFYNRKDPWVSSGLFALSLLCCAVPFYLYRTMPPSIPRKFSP